MRRTLALLALALLGAACDDGAAGGAGGRATPALALPAPGSSGAPDGDEPATPIGSDDRAAAVAAAVEVRATGCGPRDGFGAGSLLDADLVVTAAHVVAGADTFVVTGADGVRVGADVVLFDPQLDLALLRAPGPIGEPVPVRAAPATAGEPGIVALPRVDGDDVRVDVVPVEVTRAVTIRTTDIHREVDVSRAGFELAGTVEVGDSGAVVVLHDGAAGVVWARSTRRAGRAWAVDLPSVTRTPATRAELVRPVDTGRCLD